MKREEILYKVCASREQYQTCLCIAEAQPNLLFPLASDLKVLLVFTQVRNFVAFCKANPAVCLHGAEIGRRDLRNSKTY